jgi:hypothetical protein
LALTTLLRLLLPAALGVVLALLALLLVRHRSSSCFR